MVETMTARDRVLNMLKGEKVTPVPCFSGVGNVTKRGLDQLGYRFAEAHNDAKMMAEAAMTTWELYGYECVVVPFDLCLEAEVLGCVMNPYADTDELLYPTIKEKSKPTADQLRALAASPETLTRGRIPMVKEAIGIIRDKLGDQVAIGTYVLGPFTLGGQVGELEPLLKSAFKKPEEMLDYLDALADVILLIGGELMKSADYISVREMGATTDVLSPRIFKKVITPALRKIAEGMPGPSILHICGQVTPIIKDMAELGYDALSIDSKTPLTEAREIVGPDVVLCGNINPFATLNEGTPEDTYNLVAQCVHDGANAIHPGCDIWPTAKPENMEAMMRAARETKAE